MSQLFKITFLLSAILISQAAAADNNVIAVFEPRSKAVISSKVKSTVTSVNREFGKPFTKGEVLITLDDTEYRLAVSQAESQLGSLKAELILRKKEFEARPYNATIAKAKAELSKSESLLKSREVLFKDGSLSKIQIDEARAGVAIGKANCKIALQQKEVGAASHELDRGMLMTKIKAAENILAMSKFEMEGCKIIAPYDGRVVITLVNEHESVQQGQALLNIVADKTLRARLLVPSKLFSALKIGLKLDVVVSETGSKLHGAITNIGATIDPASSTVKVWLEVDNSSGKLRGGMRGRVSLSSISGDK